VAQTSAQKAATKRYREKHRERLRPKWRAAAKTYRECIDADPNLSVLMALRNVCP
jgi:hypothetical protein